MVKRILAALMTVATTSVAAGVSIVVSMAPNASADPEDLTVALFLDSTETAYRIADHLHEKFPRRTRNRPHASSSQTPTTPMSACCQARIPSSECLWTT